MSGNNKDDGTTKRIVLPPAMQNGGGESSPAHEDGGFDENDLYENDFDDGDDFDVEDFDVDIAVDEAAPPSDRDDDTDDDREMKKKEKRERRKKKKNKRKKSFAVFRKKARMPLVITLAAIFGIAAGMFAYSLSTIHDDTVMKNVYIEGLDVGGLSYDDALAAVNVTYLFENSQIALSNGEMTYTINGSDIGLAAMPEETTAKAFAYCKDGNIFQNAYNAAVLMFKPHVIVPAPQLDTDLLDEKLNECGNIMVGELKQHYIAFDESSVAVVYSGQTGYDGDPTTAREEVIAALNSENFTDIHVDFNTVPPDDMTLETLDLLIYKDPVDAKYEYNGNEVTIVPGETGRYIDKDEVAPILPSIYEGCEPVGVPFRISEPDVTEEVLQSKLFSSTLSSYSTYYGGSGANRSANVARAASLLSGTVVAPGEVFSFNNTVGKRTTENGFYTAKEYMNGESVDGIGGGTCQVSSTLYSAVLYADMGIVERLNHMMSVGYIAAGQDATVSDSGVDFRFRNTSDYPIKISAYTSDGKITVSILGAAWDPPREVKISNNTTTSGENTIVYSTRYVYSNGELIATDRLNSSTYMPHGGTSQTASSNSSGDSDDDSDYDSDDE